MKTHGKEYANAGRDNKIRRKGGQPMSEWKKVKLGDYIDILSGYAFKSKDFSDSGIPVIKIKNVCPPNISLDDLSYVPEPIAFQNHRYILHKGDVLIAMTGSHINQIASVVGRVGRVRYDDVTVLNQRVGKIVNKDDSRSSLDFIYYYLSQFEVKVELAQKAGGAANQANISPADIKELQFNCPPIEIQHRIATILSRYDTLIENYQKQIKLLEEAAQRLYKEWFVELRFPGHENTKMVDGLPEGWERKKLGEILEYYDKQRKPLSSMQRMDMVKIYPYYGAATLMDYVDNYLFDGIYLLLGEDGTVITPDNYPVLQYVWGKFWVNNHAHVLRGKNGISTEYLYSMFKEMPIADVVTGAAQPKISQGRLSEKKIVVPPTNLITKWSETTKAYFDSLRNLTDEIRLLTEARDRLLPKVMGGEMEVLPIKILKYGY